METAMDLLRKDLAFRAIINSAVAEASSEFYDGDFSREITAADAHDRQRVNGMFDLLVGAL